MEEYEALFDMDDKRRVGRLLTKLGQKTGLWIIGARPYKPTRSNRQLGYYFGVVVEALRNRLRVEGEHPSPAEVHDWLLDKFCGRAMVNEGTGELIGTVGKRSGKMDTAEFSRFVEDVRAWMLKDMGIETPDPSIFRDKGEKTSRSGAVK